MTLLSLSLFVDLLGSACLLHGFGEGARDGHDLAHGLHLRPQGALHRGELVDVPARDLVTRDARRTRRDARRTGSERRK